MKEEELLKNGLTVGQLLDFIEKHKIPRDAKVLYERIQDVYFDRNNWKTVKREGFQYFICEKDKEKARGEWNDKEQYPNMTPEIIQSTLAINSDDFKNQYVIAESPIKHNEDDNLYITAHY